MLSEVNLLGTYEQNKIDWCLDVLVGNTWLEDRIWVDLDIGFPDSTGYNIFLMPNVTCLGISIQTFVHLLIIAKCCLIS